jgi:D-sedoheptulose 7-phosphate isomerase
MTPTQIDFFDREIATYPFLNGLRGEIEAAYTSLEQSYSNGGKLLIAGNGGSAADADHIVGELMKGFLHKRPLSEERKTQLQAYPEGVALAEKLQSALPAISLSAHGSLFTAFGNDVNFEMIFAQQVIGYGKPGDMLLAISTSGNSKNVVYAAVAAKVNGMRVISLTGANPCRLDELSDVTIHVPERETWKIQDMHGTVYHLLCILIEKRYWD